MGITKKESVRRVTPSKKKVMRTLWSNWIEEGVYEVK